jgi:hypothetical protein
MIVGIDASNLRHGGGVTYLRELLAAAQPRKHDIRKVLMWGGSATFDKLPEAPCLYRRLPHRISSRCVFVT